MKVTLLFFGPVREHAHAVREAADIDPQTTLHTLFVSRFPELVSLPIAYARNGQVAGPHDVATEGDEIAFLPP